MPRLGWMLVVLMGCSDGGSTSEDGSTGTVVGGSGAPVGRAYELRLESATFSPAWVGEALAAEVSWTDLVLSFESETEDTLTMALDQPLDDPCRIHVKLQAPSTDAPAFVARGNNAISVDFSDAEDALFFVDVHPYQYEENLQISGEWAAGGTRLDNVEITGMLDPSATRTLGWGGFANGEELCAQAELEGTPCEPCTEFEDEPRCLRFSFTDVPAPATEPPPDSNFSCR